MKIENIEVFNIHNALRGMRNPKNSWNRSDSYTDKDGVYNIGENDLLLAQTLIGAGSEHRKFMRQIFVSFDVTAPIYWFKEFDTYKVGTTANSTSTMHKLTAKHITKDCFEMDDYENVTVAEDLDTDGIWQLYAKTMELMRRHYLDTKDKRYWKELVRMLPESWLQTRTVTMSFENLLNIINQRKNHKLTEWHTFIDAFRNIPYAKELLFFNEE